MGSGFRVESFNIKGNDAIKQWVSEMEFKYHPAERLLIDSMDSRLEADERKVRMHIINSMIESAAPYNFSSIPADVSGKLGMSEENIKAAIARIVEKNAAVADEEENINFIYPVSGFPTNHQITLEDGRSFSAMCAVDGMGCAFTFKQNIKVNSKCSECGADIAVEIRDGQIVSLSPEAAHVLHVDLNSNQNWSGSC